MKHLISFLLQRLTRSISLSCLCVMGSLTLWTTTGYTEQAIVVDRCVLQSGQPDCLAWKDPDVQVLYSGIRKQKPQEIQVKSVEYAQEGEVTVKAQLCDDETGSCVDLETKS